MSVIFDECLIGSLFFQFFHIMGGHAKGRTTCTKVVSSLLTRCCHHNYPRKQFDSPTKFQPLPEAMADFCQQFLLCHQYIYKPSIYPHNADSHTAVYFPGLHRTDGESNPEYRQLYFLSFTLFFHCPRS